MEARRVDKALVQTAWTLPGCPSNTKLTNVKSSQPLMWLEQKPERTNCNRMGHNMNATWQLWPPHPHERH
eukprot:3246127-Amphidinium_carterae.4